MKARAAWRPRHAGVVAPDINVTPLVDVVLVLLIIFMVVAPRLEQDIPVTLPGIFHPDPDFEASAPPLVVTLRAPGEYYVDGTPYDLERLTATLRDMHAAGPQRRLELRADARLKYHEIRTVYQRAHQIGFLGISFLVSHRVSAAAPPAAAVEEAEAWR